MSLYLSHQKTATISLRSETDDNLHDAIKRLPDIYRIVIELTLAGYTQLEIAHDLGLTQQAVSARYRSALIQLKLGLATR